MEAIKNKKYIGLALLVVCLAAWLMVKSNLEKKAARAILDSPVSDYIEYEDISVGLFDQSVTLYEVTLLDNETTKLGELSLGGLEQWAAWQDDEGAFPDEISVRFSGLALNLREMLANNTLSLRYNSSNPLVALARFGYQLVDAEGELIIQFDEEEREFSLVFNADLDEVTQVDVELELVQVREKLLRGVFLVGSELENPMYAMLRMWSAIQKDMKKVALSRFSMTVDDEGLIAKMKHYHAIESMTLPGEKVVPLFDEQARKQLILRLENIGLAKSFSTNFSNQFAEFVEDEGDITLATDMDKPIRLAKLTAHRGAGKALKRLQLAVN